MTSRADGTAFQSVTPVADDEKLNRRIHPYQLKDDGGASSGAFTDDEMSVDRASMRTPAESLADCPDMGLAQFITALARSLGQDVVPVPMLLNRAHAEVRGKKTRAIAKKLARSSEVLVRPKRLVASKGSTEQPEAPPPSR